MPAIFFELAIPLLVLWIYMSALFAVAVLRRDNSIADIGYGIGVLVVATAAARLSPNAEIALVLYGATALWAIRLSSRIFLKNRGKPEDFRYQKWRHEWKHFYLRSYFQVFMLQGAVIYAVSLPVQLALRYDVGHWSPVVGVGMALWAIGFWFEAIGDRQLDAFLSNVANKGRVMQFGLWRYTRHPNYFGESLMWLGMAIAAAGIVPFPAVLIGFLSPVLITFLLLKVSGIPMLEARFAGNPEWEAYKARTSAFIPMPPREAKAVY